MSFANINPNKRTRGKNFTDNERDVVLEIIVKYKNIIENKKTDTESIRIKNAAWNEITDEFNAILPTNRTPSQLKVYYENHKVKLKRELAEQGIKNEPDDVANKRMKFTETEEKLILRLQKPVPLNHHIGYVDRYHNNVEASTSNTLHFRNDKDMYAENNGQRYYAHSNVSNDYSHNSPITLDEEDECSSEPLKIVTEIDPIDDRQYNTQEATQKTQETVKPNQAYAAIMENNKANYKLKMTKAKYVDDYNRLKVELLQTDLKLKNQEYENILMTAAMEHKINTMKLKILECEYEIKQELLKKERGNTT